MEFLIGGRMRFYAGDVEVWLDTNVKVIDRAMHAIWGDAKHAIVDPRRVLRVSAHRVSEEIRVTCDDRVFYSGSDESDALLATDGAIYRVLSRISGRTALHAGCVMRNGRAFLLLGDSGAGKSSLCREAVRRGYLYHGDDLVVFDGQHVYGAARSILFDPIEDSQIPADHVRDTDLSSYRARSEGRIMRVPLWPVSVGQRALFPALAHRTHVIALVYQPMGSHVAPLSPAETLAELVASTYGLRTHNLGALTRCPGFVVSWSIPKEGLDLVERVVRADVGLGTRALAMR